MWDFLRGKKVFQTFPQANKLQLVYMQETSNIHLYSFCALSGYQSGVGQARLISYLYVCEFFRYIINIPTIILESACHFLIPPSSFSWFKNSSGWFVGVFCCQCEYQNRSPSGFIQCFLDGDFRALLGRHCQSSQSIQSTTDYQISLFF